MVYMPRNMAAEEWRFCEKCRRVSLTREWFEGTVLAGGPDAGPCCDYDDCLAPIRLSQPYQKLREAIQRLRESAPEQAESYPELPETPERGRVYAVPFEFFRRVTLEYLMMPAPPVEKRYVL